MKTKKTNKRALAMSFVSMLLCVCMLVGTTFAWFTDSVTSANNIITSGTLKVTMEWADGTTNPAAAVWKDASTDAIFNYDKWEPGYVEVRHIKIENAGTLALKYQLNIIANGVVSELAEVIDVYYADPAAAVTDRTQLTDANKIGTLDQVLANFTTTASGNLPAGEKHTVTLALKMQEDANNDYQGKSIGTDFSVQLMATQLTSESDSFDEMYDENAAYFSASSEALTQGVSTPASVTNINIVKGYTPAAGETSWSIGDNTMCYLSADGTTLTVSSIDGEAVSIDSGLNGAFSAYPNASFDGLENLDYSEVTETKYMFSGNTALDNAAVADILATMDLSNVTKANRMFDGCTALTEVDLSTVTFPEGVSPGGMFAGCTNLTTVDLGDMTCEGMTRMFDGCTALTEVDLSGVEIVLGDVGAPMVAVFEDCTSLTTLTGIENLDTSKVTIMDNMFTNCSALTSLDLSGWDTSNVTSMQSVFEGCSSLTTLNVDGWNTAKVTSMSSMFSKCEALTTVDLSSFTGESVTTLSFMFNKCSLLQSVDMSNMDISKVTTTKRMFYVCEKMVDLKIGAWDMDSITDTTEMFLNCYQNNFKVTVPDEATRVEFVTKLNLDDSTTRPRLSNVVVAAP